MIATFIDELKDPSRRADRRDALERRAQSVRAEGEERLWRAQTRALERVGAWLHEAPRVPGLAPLAGAAEKLVDRRLQSLRAVPIADYDSLNARNASSAVRDLDSRVALIVVREHEAATKNRKTVLRAIEEQLARLAPGTPRADGVDTPQQDQR